MAIKKILLVNEKVKLDGNQLERVKKRLGNGVETQQVTSERDLKGSHERRVLSLEKAFNFIRKAIPPQTSFDFDTYLTICHKEWDFSKEEEFNKLAQTLSCYKTAFVDLLERYWKLSHEGATALLNRAEQYVLMLEGREDIATLSLLGDDPDEGYILQMESQLTPCTEETLSELENIKQASTTPKWFKELPAYQQIYFHYAPPHLELVNEFNGDILKLISKLKEQKQKNPSNITIEINNIKEGEAKPDWFTKLDLHQQKTLEQLTHEVKGIENILCKLEEIKNLLENMQNGKDDNFIRQLPALRKSPYWFLRLPEWEQNLLIFSLKQMKNVREEVNFLSSRLRSIPGVANFAKNEVWLLTKEGEVFKKLSSSYHSSHLGSRDVMHEPSLIGDLHCERNFSMLTEIAKENGKDKIFLQTLISPIWAKYRPDKPDYYLYNQSQKLIKNFSGDTKIFFTNHPYNYERYYSPTQSKDENCLSILNLARKHLSDGIINEKIDRANSIDAKFKEKVKTLCKLSVAFINENVDRYKPGAYTEFEQKLSEIRLPELAFSQERFKQLIAYCFPGKDCINDLQLGMPLSIEEEEIKAQLLKNKTFFAGLKNWQELAAIKLWCLQQENRQDIECKTYQKIIYLASLARSYDNTLANSGYSSDLFNQKGIELFLSTLENLILPELDVLCHGSCVSGKDRKFMEMVFRHAMELYHYKYGEWPSCFHQGTERENFIRLVGRFYNSLHPHKNAEQNAPGSMGIKTPGGYLSNDICEEIIKQAKNAKVLEFDDKLATYNEAKKIENTQMELCPELITRLSKVSDENLKKLLTQLSTIINEFETWNKNTTRAIPILSYLFFSGTAPTGVTSVTNRLKDPITSRKKSNIFLVAAIIEDIQKRPVSHYFRTELTSQLYKEITELHRMKPDEANHKAGQAIANLETLRKKILLANKEINAAPTVQNHCEQVNK